MEDRIPADHPLRSLRRMVDHVLQGLSPRFAKFYADTGRPSIPQRCSGAAQRPTRRFDARMDERWVFLPRAREREAERGEAEE